MRPRRVAMELNVFKHHQGASAVFANPDGRERFAANKSTLAQALRVLMVEHVQTHLTTTLVHVQSRLPAAIVNHKSIHATRIHV